jgi:hypothetical protein
MATSDCEDKAAQIAAKLKNLTEEGSQLSEMLSGIDSQIDMAKYGFRDMESRIFNYSMSRDPRSQAYIGEARNRQAYCNQSALILMQQKQQLEGKKRLFSMQEKKLTAEQKQNDVMLKLSTAAAEKFGKKVDPAIKRFFGGQ